MSKQFFRSFVNITLHLYPLEEFSGMKLGNQGRLHFVVVMSRTAMLIIFKPREAAHSKVM